MRRIPLLLLAPLLLAAGGCGDDPTSPSHERELKLVRLVEYPAHGYAVRQQGDYTYDAAGRLVRFDFGRFEPTGTGGERYVRTYYSTHRWSGDRRSGTEVWIRHGDDFVQSRDIAYEYDEDGRMTAAVVTYLLDMIFEPIEEIAVQRFEYDEAGRLVIVRWDGTAPYTELVYAPDGRLARTLAHTEDGNVIEGTHSYGEGINPFYGMSGHGLVRVYAGWFELVTRENVILTENRVNGGEIVSWREVHILQLHESGYPAKSVQYLHNGSAPDDPSAFVSEYEYGLR